MANVILLTALTGNMKANLMVRTEGERVDSIADVAAKPHLTPVLWKGTAYESLFRTASLEVYRSVYRKVVQNNGSRPGSQLYSAETLRQVLAGRAVIINEQPSMVSTSPAGPC
ncbi:uncharacterized protein LOC121832932 [Ixodes scapularis]|uniref:uncharacterized protein LOC121832932 n=1 Tax=Ixodes scapularis TaxID=6945 RepID=UPI001A9F358C|nr:uncharacterized protein LOC121832932 [Ixodes scapularis]